MRGEDGRPLVIMHAKPVSRRLRAAGHCVAICSLILCGTFVSNVRYLGLAAAPVTAGNPPSHLHFPTYNVRDPQCGLEWQDSYKGLHKDILSGAVPQRFVVAVGVEQGLTGMPCIADGPIPSSE